MIRLDTKALDKTFVASTYNRFPVEIVRGKGSEVYDEAGKRYIDMGSGIGVTAFGIADEVWCRAVTEQLSAVQHTSNLYYTEPCAHLAKLLCEATGMKKVFFGNSGAEANECAIKAARKYSAEKKGAEYSTVITLENSFHGRTLTTLAATGQAHYHELYGPLTPGFIHVPAEDADALINAVKTCRPAAIMIECIQGEGGVVTLSREYVKSVAAIAEENDIPLIVDEVQTGNGRTGKFYAYMNYGITPDIVTTAKGLGGGLPIGATLLGEKVCNVFSFGDHGSTFGGNPVCCRGAISIVERLTEEFLSSVSEKGELIRRTLCGQPGIRSVSGLGLMVGIETEKPAGEVVKACLEHGVLCLTAKTKVRLLPALSIPEELLKEALSVILASCR